jgi:dihydrofolate reductase
MAKLIYVANVSLDGYIEDAQGSLDWAAPTDEVFTFITDLVRPVGTYLYGRRMYETIELLEEHRLTNGVVHLHYRTRS